MVTIIVSKKYGYVVLTATGTFLLAFWHSMRILRLRKTSADAPLEQIGNTPSEEEKKRAYAVNCVHSNHNFVENQTQVLAAMLIGGLEYPITSATVGAVWGVCRILYAVSYTRYGKRHPSGWYAGICAWFTQFGLFGLAGKIGYDLLMA